MTEEEGGLKLLSEIEWLQEKVDDKDESIVVLQMEIESLNQEIDYLSELLHDYELKYGRNI